MYDDKDIVGWFSLENGTHIPLKRGESKREALRNYLAKKKTRVEKNKDKYAKTEEYIKRKESNKLKDDEEIEYLDLNDISDYDINKTGTQYKLKPELRKKYERELNLTSNNLKDFNVSGDGTKYTLKPEEIEKAKRKKGLRI